MTVQEKQGRMPEKSAGGTVMAQVFDLRRSLTKKTTKDIISDKLTGLIVSGVMKVGDPLPSERELASALAVSRETIRGAIQTLAAKGIVEVSHGARTRVASTDAEGFTIGITSPSAINSYDIDSVHRTRARVECEVVGDAAEHIDAARIARLEASLKAQAEALSDPIRFLLCDREFHLTIYHSSPNRLLADFATDLYNYMLEHRRRAVSEPGTIRQSYSDHIAVVEALRAHDRDAAAAAFAGHLDHIYTTTCSILKATAADGGAAVRKRTGRTTADR
jgi:DNA-binding FadR family transcriptional regulator